MMFGGKVVIIQKVAVEEIIAEIQKKHNLPANNFLYVEFTLAVLSVPQATGQQFFP